ncbi:hypothetical protein [Pseudomonas typographi]|uniref:Uncharacterized protein n=1 Tax=Pseudomonas typographi TaxID=2715964 RepID=A0ABR7Z2Q1_9PSED|nr:hypothetical protein [Pseudomonas typographi]MBD1550283.1 hypothetical protein [Pseudomonas typographi]MBD1585951.1 hypothetical protein [Pseudomonas typographi]MBD1599684.1 hypothetical protein [Pseudomonas typographi]
MPKHNLFPTVPSTLGDAVVESCLSINTPSAQIGLLNLLELAEHSICQENDETLHTLVFRSGKRLRIHSDGKVVTVVGRRIAFHPSEIYPFNTLLGEPGA